MVNSTEALKLALEALRMADELFDERGIDFKEYGLEFDKDIRVKYRDAITAIKEALSQPEQEPVFCEYCGGNDENPPDHCMDCARPQRKPLTTDQMYAAIRPLFKTDALAEAALSISFDEYQAIEKAAHGIKETT